MFGRTAFALVGFGLLSAAQNGSVATQDASQLISDPLTYGPAIELVHLYYDEWPTV